MPIHDWTRVDAGLFHHFHQRWISSISDVLNTGQLPDGYYALAEQNARGPIPDVLTLQTRDRDDVEPGGVSLATAPLKTRFTIRQEENLYVRKADRIVVRHRHGKIVAVMEIVSPGNKSSVHALKSFVEKIAGLIEQGIHVLVVDLFPPSKRDPEGIHKAIWDELADDPFELPSEKPLTLAAYSAGDAVTAHIEPFAVGDSLADMPLFLKPERYVLVPLEATYETTWGFFPKPMKKLLETV